MGQLWHTDGTLINSVDYSESTSCSDTLVRQILQTTILEKAQNTKRPRSCLEASNDDLYLKSRKKSFCQKNHSAIFVLGCFNCIVFVYITETQSKEWNGIFCANCAANCLILAGEGIFGK